MTSIVFWPFLTYALPTYLVLLLDIPFLGLSWTPLPTLIRYVINERSPTCIQKVCKKTEIHAKIWPYIKKFHTCIQKVCKKTDIHAKIWPYNNKFILAFKRYAINRNSRKNKTLIKNSNLHSKGMQKKPEIHANWSRLLMGVVKVFKYGKRFRSAPSFN